MTGTFGNKVAPIIEAQGGIGEAVAACLASKGATTVAGMRRKDSGKPLRSTRTD